MHRTPMLAAAFAATALLADPAGAMADSTLVAGPVKAKGYAINLTATDGATDSFTVMATKTSGPTRQTHLWSFKGVNVSIKGAKATIKGKLGRYGSVNAKVTAGRKSRGVVPAGCTGSAGTARSGKLTGKTTLVLDSSFFRRIAPKVMNAQILSSGKLDCSGTGQGQSGLMLTSSAEQSAGQLMVNVTRVGGKVTQQVMRMDPETATAPASVMHMITGQTGDAGLSAAGDLSTATAKAAGGFLAGTLSFAGESMGSMASGTVSGDFAAKFDSIGTQTLPAGNDAMLMQR